MSNESTLLTGLMGHWKFDEGSGTDSADSSVNGNSGTLMNGATWTTGKVGGALNFDAVNDHFKIPDSASLNTTTNQISVTAWVNRNASQSGWVMAVGRQLGTSFQDQYFMGFLNNAYYFCVNSCAVGPVAPTNQWIHMAGTYDGTTTRLYIDGSEVGAQPGSGAILLDNKPLIIGAGQNDSTQDVQEGFNGKMDEVRLYNRALSVEEIFALTDPPQAPLSLRTAP